MAAARADERIEAVRRLCDEYKDQPPPMFRGPGLSEHGTGFNAGTQALARAVLDILDEVTEDCPYYLGTGKCQSGCSTEPRCITGRDESTPGLLDMGPREVEGAHGEALLDDVYRDWPGEPGLDPADNVASATPPLGVGADD